MLVAVVVVVVAVAVTVVVSVYCFVCVFFVKDIGGDVWNISL